MRANAHGAADGPMSRPAGRPVGPAGSCLCCRHGRHRLRSDRSPRRSTGPVGGHGHAEPPRRTAVPHDRHDRGRAVDRPAHRRRGRGAGQRCRDARQGRPVHPGRRRPGRRDRLRDIRARRARGRGDPSRGDRIRPHLQRAGLRAVPRPARRRARHRHLARRRDDRHQRGARCRPGCRGVDRAHHRHPPVTRCSPGRRRRRDARAGHELVPHGRLPESDRGGRGGRRRPDRRPGRRRRGPRARRGRDRGRDPRPERRPSPRPSPASSACSWSRPGRIASPAARSP